MKRLAILCCILVSFTACKKKEDTAPAADKPAEPAAPAPAAPAPAAPTPAKAEYKPDELFKDTAGLSRLDLMDKFKDGVTLSGTVKAVKDDPTGEYVLVYDAGNGHTVEAMIADPKPARDKKVKAGDAVTVTKCQVANPSDTSVLLRICELK